MPGKMEMLPEVLLIRDFFVLIDQDGYVRSREDQFGNPIIFYKGSVKRNKSVAEGEEEPQINILIEDIKQLL